MDSHHSSFRSGRDSDHGCTVIFQTDVFEHHRTGDARYLALHDCVRVCRYPQDCEYPSMTTIYYLAMVAAGVSITLAVWQFGHPSVAKLQTDELHERLAR